MFARKYGLSLALLCAILVGGSLLAGCVGGRFAPDGWSGPVGSGDTLYVISRDGDFLAVNLENHSRRPLPIQVPEQSGGLFGCEPPSASLVAYATPLVSSGTAVYVAAYEGTIYALDKLNGAELWRYEETDGRIVAGPVLDESDGNPLIVAAGRRVYALDAKAASQEGALVWAKPFKTDGEVWGTPAIYDNKAYFGDLNHKFYAVDLDTGELAWEAPRDFDGGVASAPIVVDGTVYVGTFESKFYALDARTGEDVWDRPFKADDWFWNKAAYRDGTIYVGSLGGVVYALDAGTGALKWRYETPQRDRVRSAPVIVGDTLVVGSQDDSVHGLDMTTGRPKWPPIPLNSDILADPWVDGATVYYLTQDNKLHAVDAEAGTELAWSPLALN